MRYVDTRTMPSNLMKRLEYVLTNVSDNHTSYGVTVDEAVRMSHYREYIRDHLTQDGYHMCRLALTKYYSGVPRVAELEKWWDEESTKIILSELGT
jgi:hypothetical protein